MSWLVRALMLPAFLLGAGCTTLPPAQQETAAFHQHQLQLADISTFRVSGRMALQTERRGFSGTLHWEHDDTGDRLDIYSPLGSQVAEVVSGAAGVTLVTSDRKTYTAEDAETLLKQTLGWSLPLRGLSDWVLGRPTPSAYRGARWDEQGRLTHLHQDGWDIEYPSYLSVAGNDLPGKIMLHSRELDLKLVVDNWGSPEQAQQ